MVKKIRLCKGREIGQKSYAIGIKNPKWEPSWARIEFGERVMHLDISDGSIAGYPIRYADTLEPVPVEEIVKFAYVQNGQTLAQNAKGYTRRNHYGELHKWFIDYQPELVPFFEENKIPLPADRRSIDEKMTEAALGDLSSKGISVNMSAGQRAIEEAKAKAAEAKLKEAQVELEALKADKLRLEAALIKQSEGEEVKIPKVKKKKEEAVA